jgi:hypothetical protein
MVGYFENLRSRKSSADGDDIATLVCAPLALHDAPNVTCRGEWRRAPAVPPARHVTAAPMRRGRLACHRLFWIEPTKPLHHFVGRLVSGNVEKRNPGTLPLAAGSHVSSAPLSPSGSFLNHGPSRRGGASLSRDRSGYLLMRRIDWNPSVWLAFPPVVVAEKGGNSITPSVNDPCRTRHTSCYISNTTLGSQSLRSSI